MMNGALICAKSTLQTKISDDFSHGSLRRKQQCCHLFVECSISLQLIYNVSGILTSPEGQNKVRLKSVLAEPLTKKLPEFH